MKNRIFTILFLLTLASIGYSQRHVCGVSHEDQKGMVNFVEQFNKMAEHSHARSMDPVYIPIRFNMVAQNDGGGRIKAASVLKQMAVLIEDYKKLGMYLYIDDSSFRYLNSTAIYENPGNFVNLIVSEKDPNAVNIFICENANPPGSDDDAGVVLGFYNPQGDYVIIRNNDVRDATSSLSHELGHFFSLPHTFFGWENVYAFYGWASPQTGVEPWNVDQFNGMYTNNTCGGSNEIAEVMDMSNCTFSADRICDTPPDYNFGFGAGGCFWDNSLRDRNGDIIDPQENNIMSYFGDCDEYQFTEGQVDVMIANFESSARDHLQSSYIPDTTEIVSDHELLFPAQSEVLEYNQNVYLNWSPAENANHYLVTINSSSGEFFEYYVDESELWLDELSANTFYFWEVQPYNDAYTDTESKSSFFTTGNGINTSVKESEIIQNVVVYPNPGRKGSDINVSLSMQESNDVTLSLIDLTGKVVATKNLRLSQGENNISIDAVTEAGIYILKMDSVDGSLHKKIVIQ